MWYVSRCYAPPPSACITQPAPSTVPSNWQALTPRPSLTAALTACTNASSPRQLGDDSPGSMASRLGLRALPGRTQPGACDAAARLTRKDALKIRHGSMWNEKWMVVAGGTLCLIAYTSSVMGL